MRSKRLSAYFLAFLVAFSSVAVVTTAYAALPLLAVEPAVAWAAGLVFQNVARQTVISVGVAANDASWVSLASVAVRAASLLKLVGAASSYEIQLPGADPIPDAPLFTGSVGEMSNPVPYNHASVRYVPKGRLCYVTNTSSTDGLPHSVDTTKDYSLAELEAACAANLQFNKYGERFTGSYAYDPSDGNVMTGSFGASVYWVNAPVFETNMGMTYSRDSLGQIIFTAAPDGVKRVKYSNGGFVADPADADWTSQEKKSLSNPADLQFKDANSQTVVNLKNTANGLSIQAATQSGSSVRFRQVEWINTGQFGAVSEQLIPDTTAQAVLDSAPGAGTGTGTNTIEFPSDYARQGEAGQAALLIKGAIDPIKDRLTQTENVPDPTPGEWADPWGVTWDNLKGWRVPAHSGACPVSSFEWNGAVYQFNAHCSLIQDHFSAFSAVMSVVWSVLALFLVLGA